MSLLSSPKRIYIWAIILLSVLLASIFLTFQQFRALTSANYWDVHTYRVLLETSGLMRSVVDVQTGARGFLQTGSEEFLEPYHAGLKDYERHYAAALRLTQDNPTEQKRLQQLNQQYRNWLRTSVQPIIALRRRTASSEAALRMALPGARRRKEAMDAMRDTVAAIEKNELELLAKRAQHERAQLSLTKTTLVSNAIFTVLLSLGLSMYVIAGVKRLRVANAQLSEEMQKRERAEKEHAILTQHNEMILHSAHGGIIGLNAAGKITFFNPAAEQLTGYSCAEVIAQSLHDMLHYKRSDGSPYGAGECPILATLHDGKVRRSSDDIFWRKDGTAVQVDFTISPLGVDADEQFTQNYFTGDKMPKPVGAVVVFRDITERKKAEAATQQLAAIIKYADVGIISCTNDGVITSWNRAASKIYGYGDWEIIGQYVDKLAPPESAKEVSAMLEKVKNGQHIVNFETTAQRKDGSPVRVSLSLSPTKNADGEITGSAGIAREIPSTEIPLTELSSEPVPDSVPEQSTPVPQESTPVQE